MMAISLYTSRVMLKVLGVEDLGIYNVVGGVIAMLGFLSSSLSTATSRFITFELGCGDFDKLRRVFRSAVTVYYLLAIFIFIFGETIGLWFVTNKMVIPDDRMNAALWVYQCSVFTSIIAILSYPYNALIIAHERMSPFAYISIYEALAKLAVTIAIIWTPFDKLSSYAILILCVQVSVRMIYALYCNRNFEETSAKWLWDKNISKEMFSFAGWTVTGCLAYVGYTQGLNILLNLFFGPVVNAARAISVQVQNAVYQLVNNFQTAVNPQIIKSYSQGDLIYMHGLIINCSKFSFFILLLFGLPIFINTNYVLRLWLGEVPDYTIWFIRIMLLVGLNNSLARPTVTAIHSTGCIKKFQIIESVCLLTVLPAAYIGLRFFYINPYMVFIVYFFIEIITQFVRVIIVYPKIKLSVSIYMTEILYPIFKVCSPIILLIYVFSDYKPYSLPMFILHTLITMALTALLIYLFGLKSSEKKSLRSKVNNIIQKKIK